MVEKIYYSAATGEYVREANVRVLSVLVLIPFLFQIQFIITGIHAMLGLFASNCNFPKYLIAIGIPQDIFMFSLFWDFYRKTYLKPSKSVTEKRSKNGAFDVKNKKE